MGRVAESKIRLLAPCYLICVVLWLLKFVSVSRRSEVSIAASCKLDDAERVKDLRVSFSSWLSVKGVRQIIIVDWNSSHPLISELQALANLCPVFEIDCVFLQVRNSIANVNMKWTITSATNLAFRFVQAPYILKVDCDTLLHPEFIQLNPLADTGFRYGDWRHARDANDLHLNGVFLARASHFREVHGFDERFRFYGWDDSDLYLRLAEHIRRTSTVAHIHQDFHRMKGSVSLIEHIKHERHTDPIVERAGICFNRLASKRVESWHHDSSPFLCHREKKSSGLTHFMCQLQKNYTALNELLDVKSCAAIVKTCLKELKSGCINCKQTLLLQMCHEKVPGR